MNELKQTPCNIRIQFIETYGIEQACAQDDTMIWDDCDAKCKLAANCPECGHPRISAWDHCMGRMALCMNPDCGMDK